MKVSLLVRPAIPEPSPVARDYPSTVSWLRPYPLKVDRKLRCLQITAQCPPPPNPYTGGHANPASNKETKATPISNIAKPIAVTFGVFAASLLPKKEHSREPLQQPTNPPKQKRPLKNPINPGFRQKTRMHFKARGIIYNYCAKCNI